MAPMHRQLLALALSVPFALSSAAFAGSDVAHNLNSFAIIFGRCVWIPPSPKAAIAGLSVFFGIDIKTEPDTLAAETIIAGQYIVAGKSQSEADKEIAWLNSCFGTYEVPPENRNHLDGTGRGAAVKAGSEADQ